MKQAVPELHRLMAKKFNILEKISANTKTQIRFIHERKLKGLLRLLKERAQYIQALAALNDEEDRSEISNRVEQTTDEKVKEIAGLIAAKQQEILMDNAAALEAAHIERDHIIGDLYRIRSQKNLRVSYRARWIAPAGNRFNQRG